MNDPNSDFKVRKFFDAEYFRNGYSTSNICVTLKSGLRVVQGLWKWSDLETGAIRKLGYGFLFAFYSNCGRICSRLWDIQCRRMAWPWKPG